MDRPVPSKRGTCWFVVAPKRIKRVNHRVSFVSLRRVRTASLAFANKDSIPESGSCTGRATSYNSCQPVATSYPRHRDLVSKIQRAVAKAQNKIKAHSRNRSGRAIVAV